MIIITDYNKYVWIPPELVTTEVMKALLNARLVKGPEWNQTGYTFVENKFTISLAKPEEPEIIVVAPEVVIAPETKAPDNDLPF